jgi:hypothetical protein
MTALLERMERNPASDWDMRDVEGLCRGYGVNCQPPRGGGSHFKISHPSQREILTIPFRKPIKPVYICKLVQFVRAVRNVTP